MSRVFGLATLMIGMATFALAGLPPATPEIDPSAGTAAIALLAGGLLVLRARKRKQK